MFNPDKSVGVASIEQAEQVARRRGLILVQAPVRHVTEIDAAIKTLAREHVDAVHVEPGSPMTGYRGDIVLQRLPDNGGAGCVNTRISPVAAVIPPDSARDR